MIEIFDKIVDNLSSFDKRERFRLFTIHDTRAEGWVKGELIWLFEGLKQTDTIDDFDIEAENMVDFVLWKNQKKILMELKAISTGGSRALSFYYSKDQIGKDFEKLHAKEQEEKWVLVVAYPCTTEQWPKQIDRVEENYPMAHCEKYIKVPLNNENTYIIALWKVT